MNNYVQKPEPSLGKHVKITNPVKAKNNSGRHPIMFTSCKRIMAPLIRSLLRPLPDGALVRLEFMYNHGKFPDLKNPKTFNEKIQWIKLYDKNPLMKLYADKYEVRKIVEKKIGSRVLNELYGVFESPDEIDFESLPESFVLKATHGSGWNIIVKNRSMLESEKAKKEMRKWLGSDYYAKKREWAYKDIPPRIVCEKYMENKEGPLNDYKFYCFNGNPIFIQVDLNENTGQSRAFYSTEWQKLDFFMVKNAKKNKIHRYEKELERPGSLTDMVKIARVLSSDFTFARVDMYDVDGKAVFGEVTFYPSNVGGRFYPEHRDAEFGDLLRLPEL